MHPKSNSFKCPEHHQSVDSTQARDFKPRVSAFYGTWSQSVCMFLHSKVGTQHNPILFNGYQASELEAITRNWAIKHNHQILNPYLQRILTDLDWIPDWQTYFKENTVPNLFSGRRLIGEVVARPVKTGQTKKTKSPIKKDA